VARTLRLLAGLAAAAFVVQLGVSVATAVVSGEQPRILWPVAAVIVYAVMVAGVAASDLYAARYGDRPRRRLPETWSFALVVAGAAVAAAVLMPAVRTCPPGLHHTSHRQRLLFCPPDDRIALRLGIVAAGLLAAGALLLAGRARGARARRRGYGELTVPEIVLLQGDITDLAVDAIVNAANSSLLGGGGVDGAIHRRGGPAILAECKRLRAERYPDGLPAGRAVATTGGHLPARWVIHTVGPVYSATEDRSGVLASCHTEALRVADEIGARTVAFPAISTGVYGYPLELAAPVAVRAVRGADTAVEEVQFVLFDEAAYRAFELALRET
jgi:O-acetyl-ADP-ribose deacetylase